jgi:hypothetical protein
MENVNLYRLLAASPFSDRLSKGAQDALIDYLEETGVGLDVNFDNIILNGISIISKNEFDELKEYEKDNMYLLYTDENNGEVYYFN